MSGEIRPVSGVVYNSESIKKGGRKPELFKVSDSFERGKKTDDTPDLKEAAKSLFSSKGTGIESLWTYNTKKPMSVSPLRSKEGMIYTADESGTIYMIDETSGRCIRQISTGDNVVESLALDEKNNVVYAGVNESMLLAYDVKTGKKKMEFKIQEDKMVNDVILLDQGIFLKSSNRAYLVDPSDGSRKASYSLDYKSYYRQLSTPVKGPDGGLITGGDTKTVFSFDPETGLKNWEFEGNCSVYRNKVAVGKNGDVYFGTGAMEFYALDGKTGEKKWVFKKKKIGGEYLEIFATPSLGKDGTIFLRSSDHNLYALDPDTGKPKWSVHSGETEMGYCSTPVFDGNGNVYVGGSKGAVTVFDGETGKVKGKFETGKRIYPSKKFAVSDDGMVVVPSADTLTALGPRKLIREKAVKMEEAVNPDGDRYQIVEEESNVTIGGVKLPVRKWDFVTGGWIVQDDNS